MWPLLETQHKERREKKKILISPFLLPSHFSPMPVLTKPCPMAADKELGSELCMGRIRSNYENKQLKSSTMERVAVEGENE